MSLLCRSSIGSLEACSHSANCAEDRRDPTGVVLGHGCYARCCTTIDVSTENCGISAVAVLTWWSMPLFMQFIDGYGRPCDPAVTLGLPLEVPQTQFIARVDGHSSCRDRGLRRGFCGGDVGPGHFSRSSGSSGVERQLSEMSMTKSSLLSRAPAN